MPSGYPKNGVNKGWFSKTNPANRTKEGYLIVARKASERQKGRKLPKEWKDNISKSMIGKNSGEKNGGWKGDSVKYMGLHNWIRRKLGTPKECNICHAKNRKMYHWSNISGTYKRDVADWQRLCVPCHKKFDTCRMSM